MKDTKEKWPMSFIFGSKLYFFSNLFFSEMTEILPAVKQSNNVQKTEICIRLYWKLKTQEAVKN